MLKGYDYLIVVTDRLMKYIHLIPATTKMMAPQLVPLFIGHVVMNHRMPKYITSDRDKLFMSKFWTSLTNLMGIERRCHTLGSVSAVPASHYFGSEVI
jgi:hypothetical protein